MDEFGGGMGMGGMGGMDTGPLVFSGALIGGTLAAADPESGYRIGLKAKDGSIPLLFDFRAWAVAAGLGINLLGIGPYWLRDLSAQVAWASAFSLALTEGFAARQTGQLYGMELPPWLTVGEAPAELPAPAEESDAEIEAALAEVEAG